MPTKVYQESSLWQLNAGLQCIGLDLSSGDNKFDVHRLNSPDDPEEERCGQVVNMDRKDVCLVGIPGDIRKRIKEALCPIPIHIPEFTVRIPGFKTRVGKCRLNHLEKQMAWFSWTSDYGGRILFEIHFAGSGKEILGTFHGDINAARARVFLPVAIDEDGGLVSGEPEVAFSANINIHDVADELERNARKKIRKKIREAIHDIFDGDFGDDLVQFVVSSLPDPPPGDAFFTKFSIAENSATVSWAAAVQEARLIIDGIAPAAAPPGKLLRLRIRLHRSGAAGDFITFSVSSGQPFSVPINTPSLREIVPQGESLEMEAQLSSVAFLVDPLPPPEELGAFHKSFAPPTLGGGAHSDAQGEFSLTYSLNVV